MCKEKQQIWSKHTRGGRPDGKGAVATDSSNKAAVPRKCDVRHLVLVLLHDYATTLNQHLPGPKVIKFYKIAIRDKPSRWRRG